MSALVNDSTLVSLSADQSGGGDSRLIFGVPYEAGDRTVIPVAELLDGADLNDGPANGVGQGLIQERALGLIEIAGDTADFWPITRYRRSAIISGIVLALLVAAALLRSRTATRR